MAENIYKNLILTYDGITGDYAEPIDADTPDDIILSNLEIALKAGTIAGFGEHPNASLDGYKVDRTGTSIVVRPKTAFG